MVSILFIEAGVFQEPQKNRPQSPSTPIILLNSLDCTNSAKDLLLNCILIFSPRKPVVQHPKNRPDSHQIAPIHPPSPFANITRHHATKFTKPIVQPPHPVHPINTAASAPRSSAPTPFRQQPPEGQGQNKSARLRIPSLQGRMSASSPDRIGPTLREELTWLF